MSDTLHVVVHVLPAPGRMADLLRLASAHAACSRLEPGCLAFEVLADPLGLDGLTLLEQYRDGAALQAHRATPHYARWREGSAVLQAAPRERRVLVPAGGKLLDPSFLPELGAAARAGGKAVALANGCFDGLHPGHAHFLIYARRLADLLVVAVNSDESVRRLKGPGRPAVPLEGRVAALEARHHVDHVVPFGCEDELLGLVRALRPDFLVKGDQPRPGGVAGAELLPAWGGRVHLVPLLPGFSTTALLAAARPPELPAGAAGG